MKFTLLATTIALVYGSAYARLPTWQDTGSKVSIKTTETSGLDVKADSTTEIFKDLNETKHLFALDFVSEKK